METLISLLPVVGGILGGPAGLAAGLFKAYMNGKKDQVSLDTLKINNEHELRLAQLSVQETESEKLLQDLAQEGDRIQAAKRIQEIEARGAVSAKEGAYKLDMTHDNIPMWANTIKALHRPGITWLLVIMTAWIYYLLHSSPSDLLGGDLQMHLMTGIVTAVVTMASTSVGFWFGERGSKI
jgi:hypothetical protein